MGAVEKDLRAQGLRRVCVQTATWNEEGIRFYRKLGYTRRATLPAYFGDGNDAAWLDRLLS